MEIYASSVFKKTFRGKVSKDTYLDVCKWLAKNVVSNEVINSNVIYTIEKSYEAESRMYVYTINLFAKLKKEDVEERHCGICKEINSSFLMQEEIKCDWCKLQAYNRRERDLMLHKKQWIKEQMQGGENL